jgi:hypothetical protein
MLKFNTSSKIFYTLGSVVLLTGLIAVGTLSFAEGRTAEVSSKQFICTATSAVGIEPRCDQYTRVKGTVNPD